MGVVTAFPLTSTAGRSAVVRYARAAVLVDVLQAAPRRARAHQQQVLRPVHLGHHRPQRHHHGTRVPHDAHSNYIIHTYIHTYLYSPKNRENESKALTQDD